MTIMENNDLSTAEWLDKAEAYCARAEHCAADVRRKLLQWGAPADLYDEIVKILYSRDFLNDTRFCEAYVHDKVEYQAWGRLKIQAGLRALQLPERTIQSALNNIDETAYNRHLQSLVRQRRNDSTDKCLRFLLQRGFTYDEIRRVL